MPEIPIISAKYFLKMLLKYGCSQVGIKGSHHKIRYNLNNKVTVVPIHSNKDLKKELLPKILKDLDIDIEDFLEFMKHN